VNRYVVRMPNDYDMWTVEEYYPIETDLSREDLEQELRTFFDDVMLIPLSDPWDRGVERRSHRLDLGGTGLIIRFDLVGDPSWDESFTVYDYKFNCKVKILTVDQWFESANSIR
jgi:hypothetical protein